MNNLIEQQSPESQKNFSPHDPVNMIFYENKIQNQTVPLPSNSYWRPYEISLHFLMNQDHPKGQKQKEYQLLNFSNSHFDNSIRFLKAGYTVTKFDIFKKNKIADTKELPFSDESFEVITGIDILNYIDIHKSMLEIKRVLKKNGIAIFRVPVRFPVIDKIRHSKIFSFLFPFRSRTSSRDYRAKIQLNELDLKTIKSVFPNMIIERSQIFSRLDYYLRETQDSHPSLFEKWDHFLLKFIPCYGLLGGVAVLILKN